MCVVCVLCLIVVPLPPDKAPFSVKINNNYYHLFLKLSYSVEGRCLGVSVCVGEVEFNRRQKMWIFEENGVTLHHVKRHGNICLCVSGGEAVWQTATVSRNVPRRWSFGRSVKHFTTVSDNDYYFDHNSRSSSKILCASVLVKCFVREFWWNTSCQCSSELICSPVLAK
jgi:hypothetical protein